MIHDINYSRLEQEAPDWRNLELSYRPEDVTSDGNMTSGELVLTWIEIVALVAAVGIFYFTINGGAWIIQIGISIAIFYGAYCLIKGKGHLKALCGFRAKSATHSDFKSAGHSDSIRPPIPEQIGHLFRSKEGHLVSPDLKLPEWG